jgi:4-diphosphocytidyl-2-C-methyl-D-erythritol kinase
MTGTGETIEPATLAQLHAVLVNPRTPAPTGAVYHAFDVAGLGTPPPTIVPPSHPSEDALLWLAAQTNDLEPAACVVAPEIADVLAALRRLAPEAMVRMSGSGATCFALVSNAAAAAELADAVGGAQPGWWVRSAVLG